MHQIYEPRSVPLVRIRVAGNEAPQARAFQLDGRSHGGGFSRSPIVTDTKLVLRAHPANLLGMFAAVPGTPLEIAVACNHTS